MSELTSTFNRSIESKKYGLDTVAEVPSGGLIQNTTGNYNNMLAANEWDKKDPKDAITLSLIT